MAQNPHTTRIALFGTGAGLLLIGQFVNWFSVGFFGATFGYSAWSWNFSSTAFGGFGGSRMWLNSLGEDGTGWQTYLMALAGPLMLAATVMCALAIMPLVQGRPASAKKLGMWAGLASANAILFGILANYTSDDPIDIAFGIFIALAGCVVAFVASNMVGTMPANQGSAARGARPAPVMRTTPAPRPAAPAMRPATMRPATPARPSAPTKAAAPPKSPAKRS